MCWESGDQIKIPRYPGFIHQVTNWGMQKTWMPLLGKDELQREQLISSTGDDRLLGEQLINNVGNERWTVGEDKVTKPTAQGRPTMTHTSRLAVPDIVIDVSFLKSIILKVTVLLF